MWSQHVLRGSLAASVLGFASPVVANDVYPADLAAGDRAATLQPAARWSLLKAEDSCQLTRRFGEGEDLHVLSIQQTTPGNSFMLTAAGPAFKNYRTGNRISLGLQADTPMVDFELAPVGTYGDIGRAVILSSVSIADPNMPEASPFDVWTERRPDPWNERIPRSGKLDIEQAAKIERVVFGRRGRAISFETGALTQAFSALNACTSEKLSAWGLDPKKHKKYTPPIISNEDSVVRFFQSRYTQSALIRGEQAIFRVRVNVETDGTVSDCQVNALTTAGRLESPGCEAMSIAQFEPALDANGEPMKSFFTTTISYRIAG